jgi:hypothetical protein
MFHCQVFNEALLLREEINMGWVFPRKADFGDGNAFHDRGGKC